MDVGTAEAVDRLLGIADQHQCGLGVVVADPIDRIEDPVLQRVGVLEFIDHRHRELRADQAGEPLAVAALQRGVQAAEEVVQAHLRTSGLFEREALDDPAGGVAQQSVERPGQHGERILEFTDRDQCGVPGWRAILPDLGHAGRREPVPGRV